MKIIQIIFSKKWKFFHHRNTLEVRNHDRGTRVWRVWTRTQDFLRLRTRTRTKSALRTRARTWTRTLINGNFVHPSGRPPRSLMDSPDKNLVHQRPLTRKNLASYKLIFSTSDMGSDTQVMALIDFLTCRMSHACYSPGPF